jgi:hypothetical protein
MRYLFLAFFALAPGAATAQLQPGEWEFTSVTTSALLPKPQAATFRRCIRQADADNPDRWMSDTGQTDCKLTPGTRTPQLYTWEMVCPKANTRGSGSARMAGDTMTGETSMSGEVQGKKFELRTKVTGKRIGSCK